MNEMQQTLKALHEEFGQLIGRTITEIKVLHDVDLEGLGWYRSSNPAFCFIFDDGSIMVPTSDPEGNGPGFGYVFEFEEE